MTLPFSTLAGRVRARRCAWLRRHQQQQLRRNPTELSSCPSNPTSDVDPYIVAAVQRVLEASGSPIKMTQVASIKIFRADPSGNQVGSSLDAWTYSPGAGPSVDCKVLDFARQGSNGWPDGSRVTSATETSNCGSGLSTCPDSIGIKISYQYQYVTPLAAVMRFFGGPAAPQRTASTDQTVMALNPTS